MAASYKILKDTRLIVVTCSGPANLEETVAMLTALRSDPDFCMGYDVMWDASRRTDSFTIEDARELAIHVPPYRHEGPRRPKRAYLVARNVDYGMMRVYESYRLGRSDVDIEVFKTRADALKWLEREDLCG